MAAKKKEIRKVAAACGSVGGQAEDRQPLRAREGQEDPDHRRVAGGSGEGAGAQAPRGSAGDRMILVIAEQRDGKLNRATWETIVGGAAARAGDRRADHRARARAPAALAWRAELAAAQVKEVVTRRARRARAVHAGRVHGGAAGRHRAARAGARAAAAHLPDARLRAEARRAARPRAHHRRHRRQGRGRRAGVRAADVPGQADRRRRAAGAGAAFRHVSDRRVSRRPGGERARRPRRCARSSVTVDAVGDPREAGGAVSAGEAGGRPVAGGADRLGRPRHQGAGEHRRSRSSSPRRSAPRSPRRVRSATPAGCRWSVRSAARGRPWRRSCISRSASPARFSIWSA